MTNDPKPSPQAKPDVVFDVKQARKLCDHWNTSPYALERVLKQACDRIDQLQYECRVAWGTNGAHSNLWQEAAKERDQLKFRVSELEQERTKASEQIRGLISSLDLAQPEKGL